MADQIHRHQGTDQPRVQLRDIDDVGTFYKTVETEPTAEPLNFLDQIQLYDDGADIYLYFWDTLNEVWQKFIIYTP